MPDTSFPVLVSSAWLTEHGHDADVKIVDGTCYLPTENRDARAEFEQAHIPGAVFFDVNAICDDANTLPHMFPSADKFSHEVSQLGINNDDTVICYEAGRPMGACRVWWMFRAFGHQRAAVLDGGLKQWQAQGGPLEPGTTSPATGHYQATVQAQQVASLVQIQTALDERSAQIIDARSAGRFNGTTAEPRPELSAGHMPGALNLPYDRLLTEDGLFKSPEELATLFAATGITLKQPVIASCGSGISAATLLMGLHLLGHHQGILYDGSWAEWASREDTTIVTR